jgi:glyoxylase-like metal-dependent hydrolase (beta-lactamase superfamily II)
MHAAQATTDTLTYEVFINEPLHGTGLLPNGEHKGGSPVASTLIYGSEDAVLTDPGFLADEAQALADWIADKNRNLTDVFVTHGHGDHWFAAGILADRLGARIVAAPGSLEQMHVNVAARPLLWDKLYGGRIPPSPVSAITVPGDRLTLEGHDLVIVEVGHSDTDDTSRPSRPGSRPRRRRRRDLQRRTPVPRRKRVSRRP